MTEARIGGPGRKYVPKKGKGASLTMRMSMETRQALEAEAENTGESLSRVAERWLEEVIQGRRTVADLLGGTEVSGTLAAMAGAARYIRDKFGSPSESWAGRVALFAAWYSIMKTVPAPIPATEAELATVVSWETYIEAHNRVEAKGIRASLIWDDLIEAAVAAGLAERSFAERRASDEAFLTAIIDAGLPIPRLDPATGRPTQPSPITPDERQLLLDMLSAYTAWRDANERKTMEREEAAQAGRIYAAALGDRDLHDFAGLLPRDGIANPLPYGADEDD